LGAVAAQSGRGYTITVVTEGMGVEDAKAIRDGLRARREIAAVEVQTEPLFHRFMGSERYWPHIVVTFSPVAIYVGKKSADFLMQYIKDTILHARGHKPSTLKLYGPDNQLLCEFRTDEYRDYKSYRWVRWKWKWWNAFWWWWKSLTERD